MKARLVIALALTLVVAVLAPAGAGAITRKQAEKTANAWQKFACGDTTGWTCLNWKIKKQKCNGPHSAEEIQWVCEGYTSEANAKDQPETCVYEETLNQYRFFTHYYRGCSIIFLDAGRRAAL